MRSRLFMLSMALALSAASLLGEDKKPADTPKPPTAATPAPAKPTDLQLAQLENIQLRMALLQQEEMSLPQRRQELQDRYGAVVRAIEAEHPGYRFIPQTGGLVPVPKAPEPPKSPEAQKPAEPKK